MEYSGRYYDERLHRNFCPCLAANGDEPIPQAGKESENLEPVKSQVMNLQAWQYIRTGLMLVGLYVVGMFIYKKLVK